MNIFLSSTYLDLKEERKAAIKVLDRFGKAYAMEKFVAYDHRSREACLAKLRECDALVLIIGNRYGFIDDISQVSVTELEYRTAKELGVPIFAFIRTDENGEWQSVETGEAKTKHIAFRKQVDIEKTRTAFITTEQLQYEIASTLFENSLKYGLIGGRVKAFQTLEQFFSPLLDINKVFNHCFKLVGRGNYVQHLVDFSSSSKLVAILSGRGGIGKSKVLYESLRQVQELADHPKILILRDSLGFNLEYAKELPEGKLLIIVDDAHRIGELPQLLAVVKQHSDRMKLIVSTRPYGVDLIRKDLSEVGFEAENLEELPEIKDLLREDIQQLAAEVLGECSPYLVQSLINISLDSPLITVIGGQLLTKMQIVPVQLTNSKDFRRLVLDRFQDTITSSVSSNVSSQITKEILNLVAALSPFRFTNKELIKRSANLLGIKKYQLILGLSDLERAGTLLRRGETLRITPDVLSDFILEEACFPLGVKTGYIDTIFETFGDINLYNIFKNFAELDWRISQGKGANLLFEVWNKVNDYVLEASDFQLGQILNTLKDIAYFQPSETMEFILNTIKRLDSSDNPVVYKIPPILGTIAHHQNYTRKAANVLWQLAKDDNRDLNSNPDHAMRVLQELASYKTYKPLMFQEIIVSCIEEWVENKDAFNGRYTPLDILDKLLAREGNEDLYDGFQIHMYSFGIDPITTASIRDKVLRILQTLAQVQEEKVQRRVLNSYLGAIGGPLGMLGRTLTTEEKQSWISEKIRILKGIRSLLTNANNSYFYCMAIKSLKPLATHGKPPLSDEIAQLLEGFPNDFEIKLIYYLCTNQPYWLKPGDYDYESAKFIVEQESQELAEQLLNRFFAPEKILDKLENIVSLIQRNGESCIGNYVFTQLAKQNAVIAKQICNTLMNRRDSKLLICFSQFLFPLRELDNAIYLELINLAMSKEDPIILISLAFMFTWFNDYTVEERFLIRLLALHHDNKVSAIAFRAVNNFPPEARAEVFQIVCDVNLGEDAQLANQVCQLFDEHYGIPFVELPSWLVTKILEKLIPMKYISGNNYEISQFLLSSFRANPIKVAEWFLARIKYKRDLDLSFGYAPVPSPSMDKIQLVNADESKLYEALCLVRDSIFSDGDEFDYSLSELFSIMANGFSDVSLSVLSEWVESHNSDKIIGTAELLRYAGENFVFTHEEFAVTLLNAAEKLGPEVLKHVKSVLYMVTVNRGGMGTPGQPMPHQVQLRDSAQATALQYPEGSTPWDFYKSLQKSAEYDIERDMKLWEEKGI